MCVCMDTEATMRHLIHRVGVKFSKKMYLHNLGNQRGSIDLPSHIRKRRRRAGLRHLDLNKPISQKFIRENSEGEKKRVCEFIFEANEF